MTDTTQPATTNPTGGWGGWNPWDPFGMSQFWGAAAKPLPAPNTFPNGGYLSPNPPATQPSVIPAKAPITPPPAISSNPYPIPQGPQGQNIGMSPPWAFHQPSLFRPTFNNTQQSNNQQAPFMAIHPYQPPQQPANYAGTTLMPKNTQPGMFGGTLQLNPYTRGR